MVNFKKVFNLKIVSLLIPFLLVITNTSYGINLNKKPTLRIPLLVNSEKDNDRLTKALHFKQDQGTVEGFIGSIVNPYWVDMKNRMEVLRSYVDGQDKDIINELQNPYDVHSNWETLRFEDLDGTSYDAKVFRVRVKNNIMLGPAKGGIRYSRGSELMNEKTGTFKETLDRLSELGATKEEVEEFVAKWLIEEAQALSLGMTLKNSGAGLDLGGGKGIVFIGYVAEENGKWVLKDYNNWRSDVNLAKIARSHARDLAEQQKIGIDIDIPAPDVNTDPQILSWYEDEYLKYILEETHEIQDSDPELYKLLKTIFDKGGYDVTRASLSEAASNYSRLGNPVSWLGVFTGKPIESGGSLGRVEATGFGGVDVMRSLIDVKRKTVAIQGFGNVGAHVALDLAREGAIVQYINDRTLTLYKEEGFSQGELEDLVQWVNTRPRGASLIDYYKEGKVNAQPKGRFDDSDPKIGVNERTEELLGADVDILVPAALENQIRKDNVDIIKAKIVVELANGPTTREAEAVLYERGISVIHDTLANAGGVIVSSFETEQAVLGKWYSADEVDARRRQVLEKAAYLTKEVMEQRDISSYRLAGDVNAVLRIVRAKQLGMLWERTLLKTSEKLRIDKDKLIERLRKSETEAHGIFRYMLSKEVVSDLTKNLDVIKKVWLFGSANFLTAGPTSDIDLIIEVSLEEEKASIYEYLEPLNNYIAKKFNEVMKATGMRVSGLIDAESKVFIDKEIKEGKGFASAIRSMHASASLLYSMDISDLDIYTEMEESVKQAQQKGSILDINKYLKLLISKITDRKGVAYEAGKEKDESNLKLYKRLKEIIYRDIYSEDLIEEDLEAVDLLYVNFKEYFDSHPEINPVKVVLTRDILVRIIRDLFDLTFEREDRFIVVDFFAGHRKPLACELVKIQREKLVSNKPLLVVGIDKSIPWEKVSSENGGTVRGDIHKLIISESTVDVVTMFHPYENRMFKERSYLSYMSKALTYTLKAYFNDISRIIKPAKRILKPAGKIYIAPFPYVTRIHEGVPKLYMKALSINKFKRIEKIDPYPDGYPVSPILEWGKPSCLIKAQKPLSSIAEKLWVWKDLKFLFQRL
ncbi:MAG: hypothetical protein KKD90_02035 [Candidatus Omnitrophica bacterium]|nr:hypothetical protein [Candidatus Omnitrophota bacterium]